MTGSATSHFGGLIDEITFYRGLKNQAYFQAHLDQIYYIPEPSSLVLLSLGIGTGVLLIRRWRRQRRSDNSFSV